MNKFFYDGFDFLTLRAVLVTITPETAEEMLRRNTKNRPMNAKYIQKYIKALQNGEFTITTTCIGFDKNGRLTDGQKRLEACVKSGISFMCFVLFGLPDDSFSATDMGQCRTLGNTLAVEGIKNYNNIASIVTGYYSLKKGYVGQNSVEVSNKTLLDIYHSKRAYFDTIERTATNYYKSTNLFTQKEIGSIICFLEIEKNKPNELVEDFMYSLCVMGRCTKTNAIQLLVQKLTRQGKQKARFPYSVKLAYVIKTWNCYISEKNISKLTYDPDKEGNVDWI